MMCARRVQYSPEQERAINFRGGHLQIIACAGAGKTEVISRPNSSTLVGHGRHKKARNARFDAVECVCWT